MKASKAEMRVAGGGKVSLTHSVRQNDVQHTAERPMTVN